MIPLFVEESFVLGVFIGLLYYIHAKRNKGPYSHLPLPPGPKRLPVVGNLFNRPRSFEWETYHKWCKELDTDILCLNIMGQNIIVLDTGKAATDLLEKRSSIYSARPRLVMVNELMGWDFGMGFMTYGDRWRTQRRLIHLSLHPGVVTEYRPQLLRASRNLLNRFLDFEDEHVITNIRHMAGETILSVAYGIEVKPRDDPYIAISEENVKAVTAAAIPGTYLVDSLPFLKYIPSWFPGAEWKRKAKEWKESLIVMINSPFESVKRDIMTGCVLPSFTSKGLQKIQEGKKDVAYTEEIIRNVAAAMYSAGSDTTVSTISSCMLGLLDHPEALEKAQAEIDAMIKPGHLPDFEDEPSLPYITAIVKESLRWMVALPISIPHYLEVEDEYQGYRIPAGSIIIPNAWAMLQDEKEYPDPSVFNPDRFMKDGKLNKDIRDPAHACWGFGRRICPGRFLAFSSIWINIASIIAAFDIRKATDAEGNVIEPSHEYVSSLVCAPRPYKCSVTPRSTEMELLIRASVQEAF